MGISYTKVAVVVRIVEGGINMPIVPVKCTERGAALDIDDAKEAAICQYCNMPFVVEKAVNNYTVSNNISASVVNVYGDVGNDDIQVAFGRIKTNLRLGNREKVLEECKTLQDVHPESYIGWWEAAKIETDFHHPAEWDVWTEKIFNKVTRNHLYQKAMLVARDEEKAIIQEELAEYNEFIRVNALKQENYQRVMFEKLEQCDVSQLDGYCGKIESGRDDRWQYKLEYKNGRLYRTHYVEKDFRKWEYWDQIEIMSKENTVDLFLGMRKFFSGAFKYNFHMGCVTLWTPRRVIIDGGSSGRQIYNKLV